MGLQPDAIDHPPSRMVASLRHGLRLKGNSLLMTLFGDALGPRKQAVWLGSLITLAGQLGLSSRLVRTSVCRLVSDDWLVACREGRRSYYRLSTSGERRVQHAHHRIHRGDTDVIDPQQWTLLMVAASLKASTRQQLQRELRWSGYGQIADGVYARTRADRASLHDILLANHAVDHVCILQAQDDRSLSTRPLHALGSGGCCAHRLECAWQRFIERFTPAVRALSELSDREAFLARTLLVHEYRRVLQRQPVLPLAPESSEPPLAQARELFMRLYSLLNARSERFLDQTLQTFGLALPANLPAPTRAPQNHTGDAVTVRH